MSSAGHVLDMIKRSRYNDSVRRNVITSYSIHYTKLYEQNLEMTRKFATRFNHMYKQDYFKIPQSFNRITSYNVCYTKLLRG